MTVADHIQIKDRLNRDHQVNGFLTRIQEQSKRLLDIYRDTDGTRLREVQSLSTGETFDEFYKEFEKVKEHHRQYPNEPVENLERAYKRRRLDEGETFVSELDNMFTGEESNGRFLDVSTSHQDYLNLPNIKRLSYLQYIDQFDAFEAPRMPIKRQNKVSDTYLSYLANLDQYLESFVRRTRPLDDMKKIFTKMERDFEIAWDKYEVPGWPKQESNPTASGPRTEGTGAGIWCSDCEKEFNNPNVYKAHLTGKKHIKNAEAKKSLPNGTQSNGLPSSLQSTTNLKERIIASHEHRIRALADLLSTERSNTRVNVERKQGMTERERQAELDALFAEDDAALYNSYQNGEDDSDADSDTSEKIYNPLKLPLAFGKYSLGPGRCSLQFFANTPQTASLFLTGCTNCTASASNSPAKSAGTLCTWAAAPSTNTSAKLGTSTVSNASASPIHLGREV